MAHTVVIQSVSHTGDNATVTGTVDGAGPFTVSFWWSAITGMANTAAVQAFLGGLLVAAAFPAGPVAVGTYNGQIQV